MAWTVNLTNTNLNSLVSSAITDGSFTYIEVLQLLNTVAAGGLTPSELGDLQTVYDNSSGLFASDYVKTITYNVIYGNAANITWWGGQSTVGDADALGNLTGTTSQINAERLIGKWFLGTDLPIAVAGGDTATGKAATGLYSYGVANGVLFVNGVAASDVNQGALGDCYLLASMGAIANASADLISNSFIDNGNGTYGVKFYLNGQVAYTTVNKSIPVQPWGNAAFGSNVNYSLSSELWVSLMEKAYVQLNAQGNVQGESSWTGENSFQALEGGLAYPIKQISGLNYKYYSSYYNGAHMDAFDSGSLYSSDALTYKQTIINGLNAGAIGWLGSWGNTVGANGKTNLVSGHAFMLLGYNAATDKFIVRNPWGGDGSGTYNVQFEVSITEFWNSTVKGLVGLSDPTITDAVFSYTVTSNAATTANAVAEGGLVTFTVTRSASGATSTVYLSTAPNSAVASDYQSLVKTALTFASNETTKTVTVNTLTDSLTEGTEKFDLNLYKQVTDTTAIATAPAYIKDTAVQSYNYALSSSAGTAASAVSEGSVITFTVTRDGSGTASTVYLNTANGTTNSTDYQGLNKSAVSFAAHETTKTLTVSTVVDSATEGAESFSVDLYKTLGDTTRATTALGYIKDQYLPSYSYSITSSASSPSTAVVEGSKATFNITRSGSGTASTVYVSTANGSAGSGDFAPLTLLPITFSANQNLATISIDINEDWWLEATEYFSLNLYNNVGDTTYASSGSAFIKDNPVSAYNYTVTNNSGLTTPVVEGSTLTFTITRDASGLASTVYVSTISSTATSADYQDVNRVAVSFNAQDTSKTVTINTVTDSLTEGTESLLLNVYRNASDTTYTAFSTAYITDPAETVVDYSYTLTSNASSAVPVAEGGAVTFTVTRSASGTASTVYLNTANGTAIASDYQGLAAYTLNFSANETVKTVSVTANTDTLSEANEYFWLNLYKNKADASANSTAMDAYTSAYIKDAIAASDFNYTITSSAGYAAPATEGGAVTFTITRNGGNAGTGAASSIYVSTVGGTSTAVDGDYQAVDKSLLNFASHETSKTITVNTLADTKSEPSEYFFLEWFKTYADAVSFNYAGYATAYVKDPVEVIPDYKYTVVSNATESVPTTEGGNVTFTITRSASGSASTVYVRSSDGTTNSTDYRPLPVTAISFAANETVKTVSIATNTDAQAENNEYFWLNLYKNAADASANNTNIESYGAAYVKDLPVAIEYDYTVTSNASTTPVTEGGAVTFTISRSSSAGDLSAASNVYVSTVGGTASSEDSDFQVVDKLALSFAAGETTKTVMVNSYTDAKTEGAEYFFLEVFKNYADATTFNYASYGFAYLKDPAEPVADYTYSLSSNAGATTPVTEGGQVTFTITRSASGTSSTVYLNTSDGTAVNNDYQGVAAYSLTFAANETEKTFTVNTNTDALAEGNEYFWLDLYKSKANASASIDVDGYASAYIKNAQLAADDYGASTATLGVIAVGGTAMGNIEVAGDEDWFAINLAAGQSYQFNLDGATNFGLADPKLTLYSASGAYLADNDDAGDSLNSQLIFTATSSGKYFVGAQGYDTFTGTYTLKVVNPISVATTGNDTLFGSSGNDLIDGLAGNDSISGSVGNDTLLGGEGQDSLYGGDGDDSLVGGVGYDQLYGGLGNDTIDGGSETYTYNQLSYEAAPAGVVVNLVLGTATGGEGNDKLSNITNVFGSAFADTLVGDTNSNSLYGLGGNDSVAGGASGDILYGGDGNDTLDGGADTDYAAYFSALASVSVNLALGTATGGDGNDTLIGIENVFGSQFDDTLVGDSNSNSLEGQSGNDSISGGAGDDSRLAGGAGNDTLDGGSGVDWVSYYNTSGAVTVNLALSTASGDGSDTLIGIENIYGGKGADSLTGDTGNNVLYGSKGNDTLVGGAGTDIAQYSSSLNDYTVAYNAGTAQLTITHNNGGSDSVDTVSEVELFSFAGVTTTAAQLISLATGVGVTLTGGSGDDSLSGGAAGDLIDGMAGQDNLVGNAGNDTLLGGEGQDSLYGGDGDDSLVGGVGYDQLYGGLGNDTIDGGSETSVNNQVIYQAALSGVSVNLALGTATGGEGNDKLLNINSVTGSEFADYLVGDANTNSLYSQGGNDSVFGGAGYDYLDGGTGNDTLDGGADIDNVFYFNAPAAVIVNLALGTATGGYGNDTLISIENVYGSESADTLVGDSNSNGLYGQGGDDSISGGAGDDSLTGGAGNDTLDGGSGIDWIYYSSASGAVTVNLALSTASGDGSDTLIGIENIYGGKGADSLTGDTGNNVLYGSKGNDTLVGGAGTDIAQYSSSLNDYTVAYNAGTAQLTITHNNGGSDSVDTVSEVELFSFAGVTTTAAQLISLATGVGVTLTGGSGDDSLSGGAAGDLIDGMAGQDNLVGNAGNDTLLGGDSTDYLYGGDGDDSLMGGNGFDVLYGGLGNDTIDGGSETYTYNQLSYEAAPAGVVVNLMLGTATGGEGNDTLSNITNVSGSAFADTLVGDSNSNTLYGRGGNDSILAGAGYDYLEGGTGNDTLDGGAESDYVYYFSASASVTVNLALGTTTGGDGADTLFSIENVAGSQHGDALVGDSSSNTLEGRGGSDSILGGAGDDTLLGGAGNDTLDGGSGLDWVSYSGISGAVTANLALGTASGDGSDTLIGIENIYGGKGADSLTGDASNNVLYGGKGNDTLVGGAGSDTAQYNSSLSDYTIAYNAGTAQFTITHNNGGSDGVDTVSEVELFSFAGVTKTAAELITAAGPVGVVNLAGNDIPFGLSTHLSNLTVVEVSGSTVSVDKSQSTALATSSSLSSARLPVVLNTSFPGHSAGEFGNDFAFAAVKADGSVVTWGFGPNGGDSSAAASQLNGEIDVAKIYSNDSAFAALRVDGSVVTWGNTDAGGNSSAVTTALNGGVAVVQIASTETAFAALRANGSVITWGGFGTGGDSSARASALDGTVQVTNLYSNLSAFAALRADGSVVTWGYDLFGGDSSSVASGLVGVKQIFATGSAFAALRTDGSVVTWGNILDGADSSAVTSKLNGTNAVVSISSTTSAFAALRQDGSVVTWGDVNNGAESSAVSAKIDGSIAVKQIASTNSAFAALRSDGSVVTWGSTVTGGDSTTVAAGLDGTIDVVSIHSNGSAFAALRVDGSVVTWGYGPYGGDASEVSNQLSGSTAVTQVYSNDHAFAALRADGSVTAWGSFIDGGNTGSVQAQLDGTVDVAQIFATSVAFSALRVDGTVVNWGNLNRGGNSAAVDSMLKSVANLSDITSKVSAVHQNKVGGSANETLLGGAGNDTIDGGAGTDITIYTGARKDYTLTLSQDLAIRSTVADLRTKGVTDGTDTLNQIERIKFSDVSLALDVSSTQSAGKAALTIGAVLGAAALKDQTTTGAVIRYFDSGVSLSDAANLLVSSGITASLAGGNTNQDFVNWIYRNMVGVAPSAETTTQLSALLDSNAFTQASFLAAVAELPLNQELVNLVGLSKTGLEFQ